MDQPLPFQPFPPQAVAEEAGLIHPTETADQEALEGAEVLMAPTKLRVVRGAAAMFPLSLRLKETAAGTVTTFREEALGVAEAALVRQAKVLPVIGRLEMVGTV